MTQRNEHSLAKTIDNRSAVEFLLNEKNPTTSTTVKKQRDCANFRGARCPIHQLPQLLRRQRPKLAFLNYGAPVYASVYPWATIFLERASSLRALAFLNQVPQLLRRQRPTLAFLNCCAPFFCAALNVCPSALEDLRLLLMSAAPSSFHASSFHASCQARGSPLALERGASYACGSSLRRRASLLVFLLA